MALQETKQLGKTTQDMVTYILFNSVRNNRVLLIHTKLKSIVVDFKAISGRLTKLKSIVDFEAISDRLRIMTIKRKFQKITLISTRSLRVKILIDFKEKFL